MKFADQHMTGGYGWAALRSRVMHLAAPPETAAAAARRHPALPRPARLALRFLPFSLPFSAGPSLTATPNPRIAA